MIYLDDTGIFSTTLWKNMHHIRTVQTALNHTSGILKLKKCKFFTKTTHYLGAVISLKRREIVSHTTDTIHGLEKPPTIAEL